MRKRKHGLADAQVHQQEVCELGCLDPRSSVSQRHAP